MVGTERGSTAVRGFVLRYDGRLSAKTLESTWQTIRWEE